jgi:hypothetical protein
MADVAAAAKTDPAVWFELGAAIALKSGAIVEPGQARTNIYQQRIAEVIVWCIDHDLPIRILGLKPRQKGSSTFFTACCYWALSRMRARGCIIGGAHSQGDNLFKMLKLYAAKDPVLAPKNKCRVVDRRARWANGSECTQETAANPEAGRSATLQVLIATEVARWALEGVANAADVLAGLLKCVPNLPGTLVGLESTAAGAAGDFYERWQTAIDFETLKAGREGFVKVFAAWFEFADSVRDPKKEGIESYDDLTEKERDYAQRFTLTLEQCAWMRWAVRDECSGDWDKFCEDYPFDPESAFLTSGRRRFNVGMIRRMKERAKQYEPALGVITEIGDGERYVWTPSETGECQVLRWEEPRGGMRYVLVCDLMTGESEVVGEDPDSHAVAVWRAGMWTAEGWRPPKLVAQLVDNWEEWLKRKQYKLWWDIDVLERKVWDLAQYYGSCRIVVETNKDRGLQQLLLLRNGVRLFHRKDFNRRDQREVEIPGFNTTPNSREAAVEALARWIREQGRDGEGVEIYSPIVLSELESFIVNQKGKSEAMSGKHDDCVLMAAMAAATIETATTYVQPVARVDLPPDIAKLMRETRRENRGRMAGHRW